MIVRSSGCLAYVKNFIVSHYTQTFQLNSFIHPVLCLGTIDIYKVIGILVTLRLEPDWWGWEVGGGGGGGEGSQSQQKTEPVGLISWTFFN